MCPDGFFEKNGICQLSCLTFREVSDDTANAVTAIYSVALCCFLVLCLLFIIAAVVQGKKVYVSKRSITILGLNSDL